MTAAPFKTAPLARIVYTADTLGYLHPCAGCGGNSQGGLARRAALLASLADDAALLVAGPGEFFDDRGTVSDANADTVMAPFHAVFSLLPYRAVYVSDKAAARMRRNNLPPLPSGVTVQADPEIRFFRAGSLRTALVFLPPGQAGAQGPSPEQLAQAQMAAAEARRSADLVIGLSPWGMYAENSRLDLMTGHFDILLGGGEGVAVPGQAMGQAKAVLWSRSDRRGKAVTVLDIFSLPAKGPWLDGVHFSASLRYLERDMPEDPAVAAIIAAVPKNIE